MSLEAIKQVAKAEEENRLLIEQAYADSRKAEAEARAQADQMIRKAEEEARASVTAMMLDAETEAEARISELMGRNRQECESIREQAGKNVSKAASFILERIVTI
ncbi:MAG: hypothetical protein IKE62_00685 [Oscillospiraceae bacterium]|nr:hypothetical protein [Oscillospiraceae bacterium]